MDKLSIYFTGVRQEPGYFSSPKKMQHAVTVANFASDAKSKPLSRKPSVEQSRPIRPESRNNSRKNSTSSKTSANQNNCTTHAQRFDHPKANVQVLSVKLKELTKKMKEEQELKGKGGASISFASKNKQLKLSK